MSTNSRLWAIIIGTLFVVNFVMLQAATTPALLHGVLISDIQLLVASAAVLVLLRSKN